MVLFLTETDLCWGCKMTLSNSLSSSIIATVAVSNTGRISILEVYLPTTFNKTRNVSVKASSIWSFRIPILAEIAVLPPGLKVRDTGLASKSTPPIEHQVLL